LGTLVPLKLNSYQLRLYELIEQLEKENKPVRIIVLKARQMGISTVCAAYVYNRTVTSPYTDSLIIADEQKRSLNLFDMCCRYYDLSEPLLQPMKSRSNRKELVFQNPAVYDRGTNPGMMSQIKVDTAMDASAGRSGTIHNLLCTEFAFWPNAAEVVNGLFESVPYKPKTSIIIESTANGMQGKGEEFYQRWKDAVDGKSAFVPFFIPWFECDDYQLKAPEDFRPTKYEWELLEKFPDITFDKLFWRRVKLADRSQVREGFLSADDSFKQEYPTSAEEAFISSGRPLFNVEKLLSDIERCKKQEFKRAEICI